MTAMTDRSCKVTAAAMFAAGLFLLIAAAATHAPSQPKHGGLAMAGLSPPLAMKA
jgi:hypothetical protein